MKLSDFEVGHAIEYDKFGIRRGLVVDVTRLYIVVVQVFRIMKQLPDNCFYHVPCYDDINDVNFVYDKQIGKGKRCMIMNNVENRNQIVDIDGYVHVVNGKVICFEPDVYDLKNPDDVEILLDFVSYISNPDNHECTWFGDSNTIHLRSLYKNDCKKVVLGIGHFNCLEDDVKERVRRVVDGFRGGTGN